MARLGDTPSIEIGSEYRKADGSCLDGDRLSLNDLFVLWIWVEVLKPDSEWIGKTVSVEVHCEDKNVVIDEPCIQLSIEEPVKFAAFPLQLGSKEPKENLVIAHVDIFFGPKKPVSITCVGKVREEKK